LHESHKTERWYFISFLAPINDSFKEIKILISKSSFGFEFLLFGCWEKEELKKDPKISLNPENEEKSDALP